MALTWFHTNIGDFFGQTWAKIQHAGWNKSQAVSREGWTSECIESQERDHLSSTCANRNSRKRKNNFHGRYFEKHSPYFLNKWKKPHLVELLLNIIFKRPGNSDKKGCLSARSENVWEHEQRHWLISSFQDTVYGKCDSEVEFKSRKGNVAEDISINRDLKACDNFSPIRDYVSPIAIVKGLVSIPLKILSYNIFHYIT